MAASDRLLHSRLSYGLSSRSGGSGASGSNSSRVAGSSSGAAPNSRSSVAATDPDADDELAMSLDMQFALLPLAHSSRSEQRARNG